MSLKSGIILEKIVVELKLSTQIMNAFDLVQKMEG